MRLNPDCVRDILLTVEENADFSSYWEFDISDVANGQLANYSPEEIIYHISQCKKADLIDGCQFYDIGESGVVSDLTPKGHQFLADIRSDTVWKDVKDVSKKVGSNSISAISQIATGVISALIKSQLGL